MIEVEQKKEAKKNFDKYLEEGLIKKAFGLINQIERQGSWSVKPNVYKRRTQQRSHEVDKEEFKLDWV